MSKKKEGVVLWFTGLSGAGKSPLAGAVAPRLRALGKKVELLDGDVVRTHLSTGLGFSREDRAENVRRIGWVASLLARNGVIVLASVISPYRDDRDAVRDMHGGRFIEVHVATPVDVCASRDVKGLYAKQRAGELSGLTGVDDPYEPPLNPEVVVNTHEQSIDESVEQVWRALS